MSQPTGSDPQRRGGWLARLRGLIAEPAEPAAPAGLPAEPAAVEVANDGKEPASVDIAEENPQATQIAEEPGPSESVETDQAPAAEMPAESPPPESIDEVLAEAPSLAEVQEPAAPVRRVCPICTAEGPADEAYCRDCGYCFPANPTVDSAPSGNGSETARSSEAASEANHESTRIPSVRVKDRYELGEQVREHAGVARFRAIDREAGGAEVTIVRAPVVAVAEAVPVAQASPGGETSEEFFPVFDFPPSGAAAPEAIPAVIPWPGIEWERNVLTSANDPALPAVLDSFVEGDFEYLVEEIPTGESLWDAWDTADITWARRFAWLKQIAQALHALHGADATIEGIRPDIVCVDAKGQARLTDLSDLLPIPVPPDTALRGTLYTAPELLGGSDKADARADLYSFGGMLYALNEGRELTEMDFEHGSPKSFILRYPEAHPLLARLVTKTFNRDLGWRFPSDEASKEDKTGFTELIHVLETCGRTLDKVRLDIAAWTTTGIVRTGNEDGFALIHSIEARQDDQGESALIIVADGMGGYEGGEVAAAMAVNIVRKFVLQNRAFAHLGGGTPFSTDKFGSDSTTIAPIDVEAMKQLFGTALREANKQIYAASRAPGGKRGMGCTCEVVFVNGQYVVAGHVGDSRTYHHHEGTLIQLTRDQTLVNRLVELGRLTAAEAEKHEQRNQLSQAVGGQPDVIPGLYHGNMKPGDWVVVCSDGLTNHTPAAYLADMLKTESAEIAARRLINSVLLEGATDNATVVLVRAT